MEESSRGFGFSTEFASTFQIDVITKPPLPAVMDALAEQLLGWTGRRGRLGNRIRLSFRGIGDNLADVKTELQAMLERNPDLQHRFSHLKEVSASFLDKTLKTIETVPLQT